MIVGKRAWSILPTSEILKISCLFDLRSQNWNQGEPLGFAI